MSATDVPALSVELLNGPPVVRTAAGESRDPGQAQGLVLAVLAASVQNWVPMDELRRELMLNSDDALHKRVSRLEEKTGLTIDNDRARGRYRLALDPSAVDAAELLRVAGTPAGELSTEEAERALALWRAGPDSTLGKQLPRLLARLTDARQVLLRRRRRRVLIIDDKVGDHLKRLLAECECTVVRNLDEFSSIEPRLAEFDLALVDVHLTDSYTDHQGLEIVNRIVSSRSDILVLGMTMRPVFALSTRKWQRKHDLVDLVPKLGDDETADFSGVVNEVRATLEAGPRAQLLQLLEDFLKVVEEARTKLLAKGQVARLAELQRDASRIHDMQFGDAPLAEVRGAVHEFRGKWNVTYVLG